MSREYTVGNFYLTVPGRAFKSGGAHQVIFCLCVVSDPGRMETNPFIKIKRKLNILTFRMVKKSGVFFDGLMNRQ